MEAFMRSIISCLLIALLAACQPTAVPPPAPELSFTRYQPINLNVGKMEFVEEYKSPMQPPNVDQLMPTSPDQAMHIWVRDRLHGSGGDKTLQIIIKDASVIETALPKPGGMKGFFTNSQD